MEYYSTYLYSTDCSISLCYAPGMALRKKPQGFIRTDSVASSENSFTDNKKKPFTSYTFISLLLVTTGALFLLFPRTIRTQSSERVTIVEKSVAVLPFINDSQDQGNMYFINGIMDEILNNLQAIKGLRVNIPYLCRAVQRNS